ncbi:MAG: methyltransferase domain-containing protein [Acidimicrobiales bacterium]
MELDEYERMATAETAHWWYGATRELLQDLLGHRLASGGLFLDAGGGSGATGAWMGHVGRTILADVELVALQLAERDHPEVDDVVLADVSRLPFVEGSFDAALCVTVLCHELIPEPAATVRELARVVQPGGYVCLMEPGVRRLRRAHDRVTHSARRFSRRDLASLVTAAGLELVRSTAAYSFLVPPAAVKAVLERGKVDSDIDRNEGGLAGLLPRVARMERAVLRRTDLPAGLSVVAVGRKPGEP